jgi:transposase
MRARTEEGDGKGSVICLGDLGRRTVVCEGLAHRHSVASMGDPHVFDSGRSYAASLGITPRQHSSGGKERLGQITRRGDSYLRTLLVHGARAYLRVVDKKTDAKSAWARRLKERRHVNVAAVALAAKNARTAWAILAHGTEYRSANQELVVA